MKISIDIDMTLYHLDVVDRVSELLGLKYKTEDVLHWVYDKKEINKFPKYFTDLIFVNFDSSRYMGNLKINNGAKNQLIQWKKDGHELYIISARTPSVQIATVEMLNRDFGIGFFKSIHFVPHKTDAKIKLYKELGIEVTIDDNPVDLVKSCEIGLTVYGINNKYTKYNNNAIYDCTLHCKNSFTKVESIKDINL